PPSYPSNTPPTPPTYTLSLHDALPVIDLRLAAHRDDLSPENLGHQVGLVPVPAAPDDQSLQREPSFSPQHTFGLKRRVPPRQAAVARERSGGPAGKRPPTGGGLVASR